MRNRTTENGIEVAGVAGTSAIILSIRLTDARVDKPDFLGFEILRDDKTEDESFPLKGFKYFPATAKKVGDGQLFSTDKHPVQSFTWQDFTVKDAHDYVYHVIPVYGKPAKLTYGNSCALPLSTEPKQGKVHSVFFNRGVAGSVAYAREFENKKPGEMTDDERKKALVWLSRGLDEALEGVIQEAIDHQYGIRAAFYEFTYLPVLQKLAATVGAGLDVQIVYDGRQQKEENDEAIADAGLPRKSTFNGKPIAVLTPRTNDPVTAPSHNKFIILLKDGEPFKVWTGSTNITDKGIYGQCNTGHIVEDGKIAGKYLAYWKVLQGDPEPADFKGQTAALQPDISDPAGFTDDITVFFSPRKGTPILETYAAFVNEARELVCGIFPFSFSTAIKEALGKDTDHLKYILVDVKKNAAGISSNDKDTIIVNGDYFAKEMFEWMQEINSGILLNKNHNPNIGTNYVHNKILLIDPLGVSPVIIVGSANFSNASVTSNDENTLVIRGGEEIKRLGDIYFSEFNRIFHHYFVRNATKAINQPGATANDPLHLKTDHSWVAHFNGWPVNIKLQSIFSHMPL